MVGKKSLCWGCSYIEDSITPRVQWPLGFITEVFPDKQGLERYVKVKTKIGIFKKPIHKLSLIVKTKNREDNCVLERQITRMENAV